MVMMAIMIVIIVTTILIAMLTVTVMLKVMMMVKIDTIKGNPTSKQYTDQLLLNIN